MASATTVTTTVATTATETLAAILRDEPPPVGDIAGTIPPDLERLIAHCLEKNKGERFQSARDLAFGLRAVLSGSGVPRLPGALPRLRRALPLVGLVIALSIAIATFKLAFAGLIFVVAVAALIIQASIQVLSGGTGDGVIVIAAPSAHGPVDAAAVTTLLDKVAQTVLEPSRRLEARGAG